MIERALVEYLANALWQIPLLAGGAWLLLTAVKAGPRVQHGVWLGVLGLAVLLPLHGMGEAGTVQAVVVRDAASQMEMVRGVGVRDAAVETNSQRSDAEVNGGWGDVVRRLELLIRPRSLSVSAGAVHWLVGLYVGVMAFGLCRVGWAWRVARRLVEGSREIVLAGEQAVVLEDYGGRLRIRLPEVRENGEVSSPMIVGVVSPVLLLPEGFAEHGEDEMRAAVLHELAHVKRRDYLVNGICQMAALPVVWHPVTHWVQGRVRRTREMVCDAMAAEEMQSEMGYARCLLALAKGMLAEPEFERQTAGVGLFSSNVLEERVMRLMETKTVMSVRAKVVRAASGATAMMAAMAMAVMFHVTPTLAATNVVAPVQTAAGAQAAAATSEALPDAVPAQTAAAQDEKAPSGTAKGTVAPERKATGQSSGEEPFITVNGQRRPWTPEERRQEEEAMETAKRAMAEATAKLNSPEFKKQMEDAQEQVLKAREFMDSAEFKKRMEDAQAQQAKMKDLLNSPEFKKEMEDARKAAEDMKAKMPQMQEQVREAMAQINSPEFRKRIEDAQKINMDELQRKLDESMRKLNQVGCEDGKSK